MSKEVKSEPVYEDDDIYAFRDIYPKAPVHIIIAPKNLDNLSKFLNVEERNITILGKLLYVAKKIAVQEKLDDGYRIVINEGKNACKYLIIIKV